MSKYEPMNIIKNSNLKEKSGTLQNKTIFVNMYIKIDKKKIVAFSDTKIEKHNFHYLKNSILIDDVDIDKILISNKICFDRKRFSIFYWLQR